MNINNFSYRVIMPISIINNDMESFNKKERKNKKKKDKDMESFSQIFKRELEK